MSRRYVVSGKEIIAISTLFQNGKTQVPKELRHALNLKDGDRIAWVLEDGRWQIEPAKK